MKKAVWVTLVAVLAPGCSTALTKAGADVHAFGLNEDTKSALGAIPSACRLIESSGPVDQQESERAVYEPYNRQRDEVAAKGGNVLVIRSKTIIRQPSDDCAPRDQSYQCREASQTWYRVSFDAYSCAPDALRDLEQQAASAPPPAGPLFTWKLQPASPAPPPAAASAPPPAPAPAHAAASPAPAPPPHAPAALADLESKILAMMKEGVGIDVIVSWIKSNHAAQRMSSDDVIAWKKAGIDDRVIQAVLGN